MNRQTWLSLCIVVLFGSGLFYAGTDGFTAFTAETARVNELRAKQPVFPDVQMEDSEGRMYSFDAYRGNYVLVTFFYSSCTTVCIDLEMNMGELYDRIPQKYMGHDIDFLSISFDPERDTSETLSVYKDMFNSDGETWRMARIEDEDQLKNLLNEFGVIVIPDDYGNFAHNSAFYLVDPDGKLIEVMDFEDVESAVDTVTGLLEKGDATL